MDEQTKEDGGIDPAQQYEDEDDDDFDPFLHAVVPRNLYHKFQTEGSKRWGPPTEILPFLFLGSCFCANEEELLRELGVDHILNVAEECPPPPTVANRKEGEKLVKHYMMVDVVEHIRKSENQWNTFESCFHFIDKARVAYEGKNGGGKKRRGSKRMKRPGKDGEEKTGERKGSGMKIRLGLKTGKDKEGGGPPEGGATGGDRVLVHCMHGRSRSATIVLAYLMKKEGWTLREAYVHVKLRRPIVGPDKYLKHQLIDYEKHLFGKSSFQNVEEFRDFQVQLTPELELKEKERKQKLKEEALQQEQSSSSNDSNTTKAGEDGGEEAEHCNKEMTADGEEEESSGNNGNADNKDEDEGKGSGKKAKKMKKKQSKKNKKASDEESTAAETEANVEEKRKKTKNKEKSKKRKDGSTSSGSATGSPRQDEDQEEGDEGECNNRKRGGSVASVSKDEPEQHVKTKKKKKKKLTTAYSNDQPPQTTQA